MKTSSDDDDDDENENGGGDDGGGGATVVMTTMMNKVKMQMKMGMMMYISRCDWGTNSTRLWFTAISNVCATKTAMLILRDNLHLL